jgi:copper resistance protein D
VELSGWDLGAICAKALTYATTLGAAGGIFFLAYSAELLQNPQRLRIRRLLGSLLLAAALASIARILLLTGSMSGDFAAMFDRDLAAMILRAGEGRATGLRLAGLLLCAAAMSANRNYRMPALIGAGIAATSFAWVGHIHALPQNCWPGVVSCLHLIGAAFWLGALPPLLLLCRDGDLRQIALVAGRFGALALVVVGALIAAGLTMLWLVSEHAPAFWSSAYGRMIAVKLFLVALLLGVAAINKLRLTPRIRNSDAAAARLMRRCVKAEIALGILILLLTASFTTVVGPLHA